MVPDDLAGVHRFRDAPQPAQPDPAALVERSADLLQGHFRIFPPAAGRCARRQTPSSTDTNANADMEEEDMEKKLLIKGKRFSIISLRKDHIELFFYCTIGFTSKG